MSQHAVASGDTSGLWDVHGMCFDDVPLLPSASPRSMATLPTQLCLFFPAPFFLDAQHQGQLVLFKYSWTCGLPQECGWLSRGCTLRGHWPLSSQQQTVANSSVNRCRTSHPASLFMLGLGLAWTCTGWVTSRHPVWFRKTLLPCGPLLPLALTFLPLWVFHVILPTNLQKKFMYPGQAQRLSSHSKAAFF